MAAPRFRLVAAGVLASLGPGTALAAPAPPAPGWVVERVRVEALDAGGFVSAGGIGEYRGVLDVTRAGAGVAVVNEVGVEDYLRGIAEMPPTWPVEALRAQAIAARTYALHQVSVAPQAAARAGGAHICATEDCQVYAGMAKERQAGAARWLEAVADTKGQVLLHRGAPILAMYSSSNGGRSVAGSRPYLRSVADPDDARSPLHRWRSRVSFADVRRVFAVPAVTSVTREGDSVVIRGGEPEVRAPAAPAPGAPPAGPGGAPVDEPLVPEPPLPAPGLGGAPKGTGSAAAGGAGAGAPPRPPPPPAQPATRAELRVPVLEFRARLNSSLPPPAGLPRVVPSVMFTTTSDRAGGAVVLDGRGFGHGIGMSQFGALGKAMRGKRAGDILAAYYGGIRPTAVPGVPPSIRVSLDAGRPSLAVSAPGLFRILDGAGTPLAVAARGTWKVVPGPRGTVRVVPPADQQGPPALEKLRVEPTGPAPGTPLSVRLRLVAPAAVTVTATPAAPPGAGPLHAGAPAVHDRGEVALALPGLSAPGSYVVAVTADAGGGRVATGSVAVEVKLGGALAPPLEGPRAGGASARGAATPAVGGAGALAASLLAAVATWARRARRRAGAPA